MLKKEDVNYYETNINTEGIPSIQLTNYNFYPAFSLIDPISQNPFIDETIYYIEAIFRNGRRENGQWIWDYKTLEIEKCSIENFEPNYRKSFQNKENNYYCINYIKELFEGNVASDIYSSFIILFYPCVNGVNGRTNCKDYNIISEKIGTTMAEIIYPDIELSPQIYKTPVQLKKRIFRFPISEKLHNSINMYLQKINLETDEDNLGFSSYIKEDNYIKYDSIFMVNTLNNENPFLKGDAFSDILIALSENILTIRRTYIKFIDILGSVGGIMGVIYSCFQIIISFLTDILYDISFINNLFVLDLDKNSLIIKNIKNDKIENLRNEEREKEFKPKKELIDLSSERNIHLNINKQLKTKRINKNKEIEVKNYEIYDNNNSKKILI